MRMMTSFIYLNDLRFHAFHGVLPQERQVGGDFIISLCIGYDFSKACSTDDVADTISYAEVYELVKHEMEIPSHLLEHVAGRIVNTLSEKYPEITSIDLELTKANPPMGADCQGAGVVIHLINDKTK